MLSGHTQCWAQPILGCNSRLGRFAGITEIISEIVDLGDRLGRSGYCPSRLSADQSPSSCMSLSGGWDGRASWRSLVLHTLRGPQARVCSAAFKRAVAPAEAAATFGRYLSTRLALPKPCAL